MKTINEIVQDLAVFNMDLEYKYLSEVVDLKKIKNNSINYWIVSC